MKPYLLLFTALALLGTPACGQTSAQDPEKYIATGGTPPAKSHSEAISIKDFADREVTFEKAPRTIAALGNGEMDIIYALGTELVGRPTSTGPVSIQGASQVEQIGSIHGIDLEKVASLSPEVVLGNNPSNMKDISAIEGIGSKIVLTDANSINDVKKQIQLFGQMLQKNEKAAEWIKAIDQKLSEKNADSPAVKPRVLMVYGAPGTYMAALNNSLSGDILITAGGDNIASDYPKLENYPQYAQLDTEKVMKSNPQIIFIMTHGNPDKVREGFMKEMQQNAAWNGLDAVKNNHVEILPADLFGTNPGTRVIEAIDMMKSLLQKVK